MAVGQIDPRQFRQALPTWLSGLTSVRRGVAPNEWSGGPVGCQNSATASDQPPQAHGLVLVDQATEDRTTPDPAAEQLGRQARPTAAGVT
jgi:hypothetical protein